LALKVCGLETLRSMGVIQERGMHRREPV